MFCGQNEVVTSRTKTVAVTVVVWKELLQDCLLYTSDAADE